jgi:hypothetical protein
MQRQTSFHGNLPQVAKAIETAGLKCAPEMWPTEYTMTMTTRPHTMHIPGNVMTPVLKFTVTDAHPANITK